MSPTCPNRLCQHTPHPSLFIRMQTTSSPPSPLISLLQHHLALQRAPERPLALYQKEEGETLDLLCKEEGAHAIDPDPLSSLFLRKSLPHCHTDLTLPFCLTQGRRSQAPVSPVVDLAMAVAQICILAPKPSMPTIAKIPVERRAALSPRHCPRSPLGDPRRDPEPARVLPVSAVARGRR
jgi:hypothetical protein